VRPANATAADTSSAEAAASPDSSALPPILLLAYRRPDTTARVMELLQRVRPERLYVACDGPPGDRPDVAAACQATRELIEAMVDWPCQLERLYREENRGCRRGVAEAIDWFFEQESEGIILEDDVLPDPSFFPYCATLLERYRHDGRVGMVSGTTIRNRPPRDGASYRYSRFCHVWGWATWRRAWRLYDSEMGCWPALRDQHWLVDVGGRRFARYWSHQFELVWRGTCDTWDYIWMLSCWKEGLLCCTPERNLVDNLGFRDARATHTQLDHSPLLPAGHIRLPLRRPSAMIADGQIDHLDLARYYAPRLPRRLWRRLRRDGELALMALAGRGRNGTGA
jgi:hypothetical protein